MLQVKVTNLRCEYFSNPLGIDSLRPRLGWELQGDRRGIRQAAYRVRASAHEGGEADLWDSGWVESARSVHVEYAGEALRSRQRVRWQVEVRDDRGDTARSEPASWETGLLDAGDWRAAWIGSALVGTAEAGTPCPYLRRAVELAGPVASARLYVTALGLYEFSINGQRVGRDALRPGWTDYRYRLDYDTYDVTALLRPGTNALGAILGDGWYCGYLAHMPRQRYGDRPRLLAQVVVEYTDGTTETIPTDAAWKTATGPLRQADLLMGETYDARLELPGWDAPGYDDASWEPVTTFPVPEGVRLVARRGPPVRATQELTPAAPTLCDGLADGFRGWLYDLRENMVGVVRLRLRGPRGTTVRLRYGERLDADGSLYTANLRKARATDFYTLRGDGEETYQGRFTFHGFQYVEVATADGALEAAPELTGVVLHSDTPPTGEFSCSDPLVNQLQRNIQRSQRGNFLEVPTDCPQRDERLGWTGDAQAFVGTAAFNMDVAAFFTKWQDDLADAQQPDGSVPPLVPWCCLGPDGGPAWADAIIICPWTMYRVYGDTRLLAEHYGEFVRFLDYVTATSPGYLRCVEESSTQPCFGDWLALDGSPNSFGGTAKGLIGTAFFAHSATLLARIAAVLGKKDDARKYWQLADEVRAAFNRAYVGKDGLILPGTRTQTAHVLALGFDLLPDGARPAAAAALAEDIAARGNHLSTGFVGTPYLAPVLTRAGRADVAFALLHQTTWPSWLYAVTQGATSIWERWDGWTQERGFQSVSMNSFNHYAYGAVGEWLYGSVAGIGISAPGYRRIVIRPCLGDLASARASYRSVYGTITSAWKRDGDRVTLEVEIPPNTRATVHVPTAQPGAVVHEGDRLAAQAEGVRFLREEPGAAVFAVGSGRYRFEVG
ncbi:MAG: glycoside hydrolase family 78 protein [Gluconacetobacter diazotrophicus]|nr:glycoside hydrolase family 78 protein [Gluconacetobacter diazotrophicus]